LENYAVIIVFFVWYNTYLSYRAPVFSSTSLALMKRRSRLAFKLFETFTAVLTGRITDFARPSVCL